MVSRFSEALGLRIVTAAAQVEVNDLFHLFLELPRSAGIFQPGPAQTLPPYFGFSPLPGPLLLESFSERVTELVAAFDEIAEEPFALDEIGWMDAVNPLWGANTVMEPC